MSRRRKSVKREILPDPIYNDLTLAKFVNTLMLDGKKSTAQNILYGALDQLRTKVPDEEPLEVFKKAIENTKPAVEVKSRRVGGATYQVPVDVRPSRRLALSMRWIVEYSRKRSEKNMANRLSSELADAFNSRGNAVKKREDVHKMAEANRAFSHFSW
jgi:small subunit ribosomal protein S7